MMSMPQLSGSLSSRSDKIRAAAAEELREHLAEVDPHLRERVREELLRRAVDLRDDVQQLFARGGEIVVLRFEKTVALLEFVVFVDGVEIDRAHVVELTGQLGDDRFELRAIDVGRGSARSVASGSAIGSAVGVILGRLAAALQLHAQAFSESRRDPA